MAKTVATILSYGMGVESSAILLRWIMSPVTRPCSLEDLIVITSQVGDEYTDTGRDVEAHILPLMRAQGIRYVQVARHGHFEAEGITVLDDSRTPARVLLEGDYKLSDELKRNGTVPQYGGVHRCALKFKAWVIEQWLEEHVRGRARHAIGYNADETGRVTRSEYAFSERIAFGFNVDEKSRIDRSCEYNTLSREAFYPLLEWAWDRRTCIEYIRSVLGITWKKSACVYCPFNALRDDAIERQREHPRQVGDAMRMEHLSLALNPRGTIYKGRSLIQITIEAGNDVAVELYRKSIESEAWALYRVRRIYSGKGKADRAVEKLQVFAGPAEARMARSRLVAVLLSKNCAESRTYGMSVEARQTSPPEKSSSPSRRLLSKPKPDMDWIGSMGAGPPCNFTCFDITPQPLRRLAKQRRRSLRARNCEAETWLLPPVTEGSRADSAIPVVP